MSLSPRRLMAPCLLRPLTLFWGNVPQNRHTHTHTHTLHGDLGSRFSKTCWGRLWLSRSKSLLYAAAMCASAAAKPTALEMPIPRHTARHQAVNGEGLISRAFVPKKARLSTRGAGFNRALASFFRRTLFNLQSAEITPRLQVGQS